MCFGWPEVLGGVGGTQQAARAAEARNRGSMRPSRAERARATRRGSRAHAVRVPVRAPGGGFQAQLPRRGPPAGGRLVRAPELARRGPPLTPAAGRGGAAADPAHPAAAGEPGRNRAAGPERPAARRKQWERRWRLGPRSPGPGGDGRPRHEPRSQAPPCAARGPRRAASASPGPHPGAGDAQPGLRMMVDCQVSATSGLAALPGVAGGWREDRMSPATPHPAGREHGAAFTLSARLRSSAFNPSWYNWETEARRDARTGPRPTRWAESRGTERVSAS